jgi:hypothetical protein
MLTDLFVVKGIRIMTDCLTDAELLKMATSFDVYIDPASKTVIRVVARYWSSGGKSWAVTNETNFVLNTDGGWEYEQPTVGARDEDFLARTRWHHPRQAIEAAFRAVDAMKLAEQSAEQSSD